jgi:hypothetical protein
MSKIFLLAKESNLDPLERTQILFDYPLAIHILSISMEEALPRYTSKSTGRDLNPYF